MKTFWLNKGKLADAFEKAYKGKIITAVIAKHNENANLTKETLKANTLRDSKSSRLSGTGSGKVYTKEQIEAEEDPVKIKQMIADLGSKIE